MIQFGRLKSKETVVSGHSIDIMSRHELSEGSVTGLSSLVRGVSGWKDTFRAYFLPPVVWDGNASTEEKHEMRILNQIALANNPQHIIRWGVLSLAVGTGMLMTEGLICFILSLGLLATFGGTLSLYFAIGFLQNRHNVSVPYLHKHWSHRTLISPDP